MFKYTPKQLEALRVLGGPATNVCLEGGGRSGKTLLGTAVTAVRALKEPNSTHLIARLRFTDVKTKVAMKTWPDMIRLRFPALADYKGMNRTDWFYTFPNGSKVWFGGLDDSARIEKILGSEFSTIYLNEISQIKYDTIPIIETRLAEKNGLKNMMIYDLNPLSTRFWAYKLFHEKIEPRSGQELKNPHLYEFIKMNPTDNLVNIDKSYIARLESLPERERQRFLLGNYISEVDGALWNLDMLEENRVTDVPDIVRKLVAIDPAVTANKNSDETGIIVGGSGIDGIAYVEADYSCKVSPNEWAQRAVNAYHNHNCDAIVAETNNGGDMVKSIIKNIDPTIKVISVHASRGKLARAEPIAALYEQGKVKHAGRFPALEDQMTTYAPKTMMKSPDRLDALVWLLSELMLKTQSTLRIRSL